MDSDESQEASNSPPCFVDDGRLHPDRLVHVVPFASSIHMTSLAHSSGQSNGDTAHPIHKQQSSHNGNNNSLTVTGEDDSCAIIHSSNSNRNYSTAYGENGYSPKNTSSSSTSSSSNVYPLGDSTSSVKLINPLHSKSSHQMNRNVNTGHQVTPQVSNVPANSPQCVFMIQQNSPNDIMSHAHNNNGLPTSVVLATGLPLPISPVTLNSGTQHTNNTSPAVTTSINLPSLHQYALASSKRKTSQFSFMPIDAAILSSSNHHSHHHHHHHHNHLQQSSSQHNHQHALSMHNSPASQSKSAPSLQLLPSSSSDFAAAAAASINNACPSVTSSVIRGAIGQSTSSHPLSLSPSSIPATSAVVVGMKNRDEKRRATHNEVERRRRDKINSWILKLSKLVPDCNSDQTKQGQSKGGILAKTCDYIASLEGRLSAIERDNQDLKNGRIMLLDKISELEREKHKLLSELSSSIHRGSSPSSPSSGHSVVTSVAAAAASASASAASLCTSASMASLFAAASSVNQIKQERLSSSLANNPQSDSANSSGTNHVHSSFDTSSTTNGSMIDQTSVIVSVTSTCPLSCSLQNCIPAHVTREETQNSLAPHHTSRLNDENKMNCCNDDTDNINNNDNENRDDDDNDNDDDDEDKSPLIMHTSDDNSSPSRGNFPVTPNDKLHVHSDTPAPADSNNEGLVNLKISPPPHHTLLNKSPCSPCSHGDVVTSSHSSVFSSSTDAATSRTHSFVHPHINY